MLSDDMYRRRPAPWLLVLAVLMLLTGCELLGGDDRALRIETEADTFVIGQDTSFTVTVENVGERTFYYNCCLQVSLQKLHGHRVVEEAFLPVCEALCPTALAPGEEVTFDEGDGLGELVLDVYHEPEARYRIKYGFFAGDRMRYPLPESELVSNRFRIVASLHAETGDGQLVLENTLDRPLAYVALEADEATLVDLAPPSEWPHLAAGEQVALPYDSLMGYESGDDQAVVYWSDEGELWSHFWIDLD